MPAGMTVVTYKYFSSTVYIFHMKPVHNMGSGETVITMQNLEEQQDKQEQPSVMSTEIVQCAQELGNILKPIYLRMKLDGYVVVGGKITKMKNHE